MFSAATPYIQYPLLKQHRHDASSTTTLDMVLNASYSRWHAVQQLRQILHILTVIIDLGGRCASSGLCIMVRTHFTLVMAVETGHVWGKNLQQGFLGCEC